MDEAVLDTGIEVAGAETQDTQQEAQDQSQALTPEQQSRKDAKAYQDWLKGLKTEDAAIGKFAKQAKDDYYRSAELAKLDSRGIDGIREKYALLDSVSHGDLKGAEAIGAIQDELQTFYSTDDRIVAGDPSVLDEFDDAMKGGIIKMMPSLLAMQQTIDPDGFNQAILPHTAAMLRSSGLLQNHNAMVDLLEEQPPSWLPKERVEAWYQDKLRRIGQILDTSGNAINAQLAKAKEPTQNQSINKQQPTDRQTELEIRERNLNWNSKVQPQLLNDAQAIFREEYKPYFKSLHLDVASLNALQADFLNRMYTMGNKNRDFKAQMDRFFASKNPNPAAVANYAKAFFSKPDVGKAVMTALINERYKGILNRAKPAPAGNNGNRNVAPTGPKEYVVSVHPANADINFKHPNFPVLRAQKKFPMKDGRVAVLRS